jgi:hypothetical protein
MEYFGGATQMIYVHDSRDCPVRAHPFEEGGLNFFIELIRS